MLLFLNQKSCFVIMNFLRKAILGLVSFSDSFDLEFSKCFDKRQNCNDCELVLEKYEKIWFLLKWMLIQTLQHNIDWMNSTQTYSDVFCIKEAKYILRWINLQQINGF
jgi:hypothetical protein